MVTMNTQHLYELVADSGFWHNMDLLKRALGNHTSFELHLWCIFGIFRKKIVSAEAIPKTLEKYALNKAAFLKFTVYITITYFKNIPQRRLLSKLLIEYFFRITQLLTVLL